MDELEKFLVSQLQGIPSGGWGDVGAYGNKIYAAQSAKTIRLMIEQAVKDAIGQSLGTTK